jgi:formamidopyrimidine-DNA glycosylase
MGCAAHFANVFLCAEMKTYEPALMGETIDAFETRGKALLTHFSNGLTLYHNRSWLMGCAAHFANVFLCAENHLQRRFQRLDDFTCNNVMYHLLHWLQTTGSAARGGFVHIPYMPQISGPSGITAPD